MTEEGKSQLTSNFLNEVFANGVCAIGLKPCQTKHVESKPSAANKQPSVILVPPFQPFSPVELFDRLRQILAAVHTTQMSFERLAHMTGKSKSTTYHWFKNFANPQVMAFMCLLEWIPDPERHAFIHKHCRTLPTLFHPSLVGKPGTLAKLHDLLRVEQGLTVLTGAQEWTRTFVLTALGHSFNLRRDPSRSCLGIDIHTPRTFVPVGSLFYINPAAGLRQIKDTTIRIMPKVATASGTLLLFNGVWNAVPEVRPEIIRASQQNHVVVAEIGIPDPRYITQLGGRNLNRITVSPSKRVRGRINVSFRSKSPLKP